MLQECSSVLKTQTAAAMQEHSNDGLRCLLYCAKSLSQEQVDEWHTQFKLASSDMEEMEKRKNKRPNKIDELMSELEQDLNVLGSSALEDKLQVGIILN